MFLGKAQWVIIGFAKEGTSAIALLKHDGKNTVNCVFFKFICLKLIFTHEAASPAIVLNGKATFAIENYCG